MTKALTYASTKTYCHSIGLSCCFRQWRAKHSHCQYLHGYALQVKLEFRASSLDQHNWVQDFGGLKGIKQFLEHTFDHRLIVAEDDPMLEELTALQDKGLAQIVTMPRVGCEAFAEYIYDWVSNHLGLGHPLSRIKLYSVEVREHEGNSAIVYDSNQIVNA